MTEQQTRATGPRRGEATAQISISPVVRTGSGIPALIEATVTNSGTIASAFSVLAHGVDPAWLPAPVSTPVLAPGVSATVALRVHPAAGTLAAQYPMAVTAQPVDLAGTVGGAKTVADFVLVVSPRAQISMELNPTSVTAFFEKKTTLLVRNTGAGDANVTLKPVTTGSLKIHLAKTKLQLGPGESTKVSVRTTAARPQIIGITMRHKYRILARGTEAERHAEGEFVQHPLIAPAWMKVIGLLLVLAVWVGAGVVFIPKLTNLVSNPVPSISAASIANHVVGGAKAVKGSGNGGGSGKGGGKGGGGGGSGSGKGSNGSGTQTGTAAAGGQKQQKPTTVQLNGTVTAKDPSGVTVTLKPTSLVDESADSGQAKPLGLTGAVLAGFNTTGKVSPSARLLIAAVSKEPTTRSVVTGNDGAWTFAGVKSPGYYLVVFSKSGYETDSYVVDSSSAEAQNPIPVTMTAGQGTLSGTVKGPDGKLVGGAAITITDGTSTITASTITTGDNIGHWQVTGLSTPASYTVSATKNGMSLESKLVDLPASGSRTIDLALRSGVATLTGKILGADSTGAVVGIGGANVTVSDGQSVTRTATTITEGDLAGTFTVPSLPAPGDYTVTLSADGYSPQTSTLHIGAGQGSASLGSATLITSQGTVQGVVKEKLNGTALVGAGLTLTSDKNSYKTISTSTGDFRINGVIPGTYTLTTQMFGYTDDIATIDVTAGGTASINPVLVLLPDGVLPSTSTIKGSAIDGTTGKPLTVCATPTSACLTASVTIPPTPDGRRGGSSLSAGFVEGGSYSLGGLLPGTYAITITAPGYAAVSVSATVGQSATTTAPVAQLFPAPYVHGTITNGQGAGSTCVFAVETGNTNWPLSCPTAGHAEAKTGAQCFTSPVQPSQYSGTSPTVMCAYTDAGNAYRINLPENGSWTMYVVPSDPDYIPVGLRLNASGDWVPNIDPVTGADYRDTYTLQNGMPLEYSRTLSSYGHIQATVLKPDATNRLSPLSTPVPVYVTNKTTGVPVVPVGGGSWTTSSNGSVTITGLAEGTYTVSATDPVTLATGSVDVPVTLSNTASASLPLVSSVAPYVGRLVTSIDGTTLIPIVGATVTLTAPVAYAAGQTTATPGTLVLKTDAMGCFAVLSKSSAGVISYPSVPSECVDPSGTLSSTGTTRWADTGTNTAPKSAGLPDDGANSFVSNRVDSLQVAVGSGTEYQSWTPSPASYVFSSTGVNTLQPRLTPNPVPFAGVTMTATPAGPSDWTAVRFTVAPAQGSASGLAISASGTAGSTTGALSFTDSNAGTSNYIRPGTYTVTARATGFEDDTATLVCYAPNTPDSTTNTHANEASNPGTTCYWQPTASDPSGHRLTLVKDGSITVTTTPGANVTLNGTLDGANMTGTSLVNGVSSNWGGGKLSGTADNSGTVVFANLRPASVNGSTAVYTISLIAPPGFYNATMSPTAAPNTFQVALSCTGAVNNPHDDGVITLGANGTVSCPADLQHVDVVGGSTGSSLETGFIKGSVIGFQSTTTDTPSTPVNGIPVAAYYCDSQALTLGATAISTCTHTTNSTPSAQTTTANDGTDDGTFDLTGDAGVPLQSGFYEVDISSISGWAPDAVGASVTNPTTATMVVYVANGQAAVASAPASAVPVELSVRQAAVGITIKVTKVQGSTTVNVTDATVVLTNNAGSGDTCTVVGGVAGQGVAGVYTCSGLTPGSYSWVVSGTSVTTQSGTYPLGTGGGTLPITLTPFATSFSGAITVNDGADLSTLSSTATWVYVCTGTTSTATDCWNSGSVVNGTDGQPIQEHPTSTGTYVLANIPANTTSSQRYWVFARDDADGYTTAGQNSTAKAGPIQVASGYSTTIPVPGTVDLKAPTHSVQVTLTPTTGTDNLCGATVTLTHTGVSTVTKSVSGGACSTAGAETVTLQNVVRGTWTESVDLSGLSSGTHVGAGAVVTGNDGTTLDQASLTVPAVASDPVTGRAISIVESQVTPAYAISSSIFHAAPSSSVTITVTNETTTSISKQLTAINPPSTGSSRSGSPIWIGPGDWLFDSTFTTSVSGGTTFWALSTPELTVNATTGAVVDKGTSTADITPTTTLTETTASATISVNVVAPDGNHVPNAVVHITDGSGHDYSRTTDASGVAKFCPGSTGGCSSNGLPYGNWSVTVTATNYEASSSQALNLTNGLTDPNYTNNQMTFAMSPLVTATFPVTDDLSQPVAGIVVSLPAGSTSSGPTSCTTGDGTGGTTLGSCSISNVKYNDTGWTVSLPSLSSNYVAPTIAPLSTCPGSVCTAPVTKLIQLGVVTGNLTFQVNDPSNNPLTGVVVTLPLGARGSGTDLVGSPNHGGQCTTIAAGTCVITNVRYNLGATSTATCGSATGGCGTAGSGWPVTLTPITGFSDPGTATATVTTAGGTYAASASPYKLSLLTGPATFTITDSANASTKLAGVVVSLNTPTTKTCTTGDGTGGTTLGACTISTVPYNFGSSYTYASGNPGVGSVGSAWTVSLSKTGWTPPGTAPTVAVATNGSASVSGTFAMTVLTVNVKFTITDDNSHALDGVTIGITGDSSAGTCTTGAAGSTTISGNAVDTAGTGTGTGSCIIPSVPYTLSGNGPTWTITLSRAGYDASGTATTFTISGAGTVTSSAPSTYAMTPWTQAVSGTVSGSPDGITVACNASSSPACAGSGGTVTYTAPGSSYSIAGLGLGTWDIKTTKTGYADGVTTITIGSDKTIKIGVSTIAANAVNLVLGTPITAQDATVTLSGYAGSTGSVIATPASGGSTKSAGISSGSATFTGASALSYDPSGWTFSASGVTGYHSTNAPTVSIDPGTGATTVSGPLTMAANTGTLTITSVTTGATVIVAGAPCTPVSGTCTATATHGDAWSVALDGYNTVSGTASFATNGGTDSHSGSLGSPWTNTISGTVPAPTGTGSSVNVSATCTANCLATHTTATGTYSSGTGKYSISLWIGSWTITVTRSGSSQSADNGSGTASVTLDQATHANDSTKDISSIS